MSPENKQRSCKIELNFEALICCDLKEFQLFFKKNGDNGKPVEDFCRMADKPVCAEIAKNGLCARMRAYLSSLSTKH